MNRMWEIREGYTSREKDTEESAYECGFEDGYTKAMEEIHKSERRSYRRY